ncbi:hypothetical protein ACJX0J_024949, partial [Zea mays]
IKGTSNCIHINNENTTPQISKTIGPVTPERSTTDTFDGHDPIQNISDDLFWSCAVPVLGGFEPNAQVLYIEVDLCQIWSSVLQIGATTIVWRLVVFPWSLRNIDLFLVQGDETIVAIENMKTSLTPTKVLNLIAQVNESLVVGHYSNLTSEIGHFSI